MEKQLAIIMMLSTSCSIWCQDERNDLEEIHGTVGVGFVHKLKTLEFLNRYTTDSIVELALLTEDGKSLFPNTWLKLRWASNEIYGLPLEGNHGVSTYYVKATTSNYRGIHEVRLYISTSVDEFLHKIKLCTSLSTKGFMSSLDTRYALAELLAKYLMDTTVENVKIKEFRDGCFFFSFLHIEDGSRCNFRAFQEIHNKLFDGTEISEELKLTLSRITEVTSVNLTISESCSRASSPQLKKEHLLLKTLAPVLILVAIIVIPVGIACYVCRGVRRRQNRMLQQQDKILKDEEAKRLAQIVDYKKGCGFHQDSFDSGISESTATKWKEDGSNSEKAVFINKILDQYIPQILLDKYQGKSVTSNIPIKKSLNPFNHLLDIRSTRDKNRLKKSYTKHSVNRNGPTGPNRGGTSNDEGALSRKRISPVGKKMVDFDLPLGQNERHPPLRTPKVHKSILHSTLSKGHRAISFNELQAQEAVTLQSQNKRNSNYGNYRKVQDTHNNSTGNINDKRKTRPLVRSRTKSETPEYVSRWKKKISLQENFNDSSSPGFSSVSRMACYSATPPSSSNTPTRRISLLESLKNFAAMMSSPDVTIHNNNNNNNNNNNSGSVNKAGNSVSESIMMESMRPYHSDSRKFTQMISPNKRSRRDIIVHEDMNYTDDECASMTTYPDDSPRLAEYQTHYRNMDNMDEMFSSFLDEYNTPLDTLDVYSENETVPGNHRTLPGSYSYNYPECNTTHRGKLQIITNTDPVYWQQRDFSHAYSHVGSRNREKYFLPNCGESQNDPCFKPIRDDKESGFETSTNNSYLPCSGDGESSESSNNGNVVCNPILDERYYVYINPSSELDQPRSSAVKKIQYSDSDSEEKFV